MHRKPELNKAAAVEAGASAGRDVSEFPENATSYLKKTLDEPAF